MANYVAWSEIHSGKDDGNVVIVRPGDAVSASDLGLDDEQFQELIDGGSVREQDYPVPEGKIDQSPTEFYKEKLSVLANPEVDQQQFAEAVATAQGAPTPGEVPPGSPPDTPAPTPEATTTSSKSSKS